uniref:Putative ovule protein n=1 Tax=Solanum chacoense TaxID=4108 RepID=A0A0V0HNR7_SOLCH
MKISKIKTTPPQLPISTLFLITLLSRLACVHLDLFHRIPVTFHVRVSLTTKDWTDGKKSPSVFVSIGI